MKQNGNQEHVAYWKKINISSLFIVILSVCLYVTLTKRNVFDECLKSNKTLIETNFKKVWFYGKHTDISYLEEIITVLNRLGYKNSTNKDDWDLLWAHDYPFRKLFPDLKDLKSHQKVNHFPGCGYLTNKVHLATTLSNSNRYIPKAFRLPEDKNKLIEYSVSNPSAVFVQKDNDHRRIKIKDINNIDLESKGTFVQEYIDKPLLVSGHKFDIGIYTIITSIDPLRVYIYNGEALLRFCPAEYYPFDPENLDKYVIGDDYLPIWEIPALDYYYNSLGLSMRDSFNAYLQSIGKNYTTIWSQIDEALRMVIQEKERYVLNVTAQFNAKNNFFEVMRFDFIVDENLTVYLLEANMSPNLSSQHFPKNKQLYQQVLYNLLGIVGIGERINKNSLAFRNDEERNMIAADKHIAVYPQECNSDLCKSSCEYIICQLCKPCLQSETKEFLMQAVYEHFHKSDCKRIFPPEMRPNQAASPVKKGTLSTNNYLQLLWYQGKCLLDKLWCQ